MLERTPAAHYLKDFGTACECGIARAGGPDLVAAILEVRAQTSRHLAGLISQR